MFDIVGKRFSPEEFDRYAQNVPKDGFKPSMVVLHNTSVPSLAQRPNGFTPAHMEGLRQYYANVQGWSGGPHLFVDQNGIWAFNPINLRGVHSPSWNSMAFGVEMLGDYASESFSSGPGLLVQQNAQKAVASLYRRMGVYTPDDGSFRLHKEDPKTTHDCPGAHVGKASFLATVQNLLSAPTPAVDPDAVTVVVYRKGRGSDPVAVFKGRLQSGRTVVLVNDAVRATGVTTSLVGTSFLTDIVGGAYDVRYDATSHKVYVIEREGK